MATGLPIQLRLDRSRETRVPWARAATHPMNLEPKRILLAEDHFVSRHLLERNLTNWGFQVQGVEDGEAALKVLEGDNPPAIVVIDWMMPKMDGLEVCRRI